jgi:threonine synthase
MIIASTAHPAKFIEVVKQAIGIDVPLPEALSSALNKKKQSIHSSTRYEDWKALLLS